MFNFTLFLFLTSFSFLVIATITDIKYREISNKLIISMLTIGIITKILQTIFYKSFSYILNSIFAIFITFIICFILWEIGAFAGGDLKLFLVLAMFNPFNLNMFVTSSNIISHSIPIFPLILIVASVFSIIPYFFFISSYYLFSKKHYLLLISRFKSISNLRNLFNSIIIIFFINSFLNLFSLEISSIFLLIISTLFLFIFSNIKTQSLKMFYYSITCCYLFLFIISILNISSFSNIFRIKDILSIILFILFISILSIVYEIAKQKILVKEKSIFKLKEGDVPKNNYYFYKGKLEVKKIGFLSTIKKMLNNTYYKNLKIDSNKAGGLNKENIRFIKYLYKSNLISNKIILKKTLPFTPAVLIAYLFLNIAGDII